jgi:hypothetical protein
MRLMNTTTYDLYEFYDENIPEYPMLSHVWGDDEIIFQDLQNLPNTSVYLYAEM